MIKHHELHCFDYVNHDYASVREALLADPLAIFRAATTRGARDAANSELRVVVGAMELAAEIEIDIVSTWPSRSPLGKPAQAITLTWKSPRRPGWFPTMSATLTCYALSSTETELDFDGTYDPPLGVFGAAIDAVALHEFAERAVANFVKEVASYLREEIGRRKSARQHDGIVAHPVV
ncbi:MAG: hypothetical protein JNL83_18780 [Myxococcales bacterium]|nr:hypothetical protein [Myxococcales bacterium]